MRERGDVFNKLFFRRHGSAVSLFTTLLLDALAQRPFGRQW
jgi:hypothetical protein